VRGGNYRKILILAQSTILEESIKLFPRELLALNDDEVLIKETRRIQIPC